MSNDDDKLQHYEPDPNVDKIEPSRSPNPFVEIFRWPDTYAEQQETYPDIDSFADEVLEAQGAEIVETETYYPESDRKVRRYPNAKR